MTTDTVGGVWSYSVSLCSSLVKYGIKVTLLAMGTKPNKGQLIDIEQLKRKGIDVEFKEVKLEWMDNPQEDIVQASTWIKKMVDKFSPDLIHFNNYAQAAEDWGVSTIVVAHSCVASWWKAVKNDSLPAFYKEYVKMVNQAFSKADALISPTHAILQEYQNLYGIHSNQAVIPNGFQSSIAAVLPSKRNIIFAAGRIWDEAKNISLLLEAARDIKAEIFIAGSASPKFPSVKNVTFLGELSREQVTNWMRISRIYALPVKYEPFGLSFLEAANYSNTLIGGDIATLREIWEDSMVYCTGSDKKYFSELCNELLGNTSKTKMLGDKAYERSRYYTLDRMTERYYSLYSSM
mgnify:CR=1 FL=1